MPSDTCDGDVDGTRKSPLTQQSSLRFRASRNPPRKSPPAEAAVAANATAAVAGRARRHRRPPRSLLSFLPQRRRPVVPCRLRDLTCPETPPSSALWSAPYDRTKTGQVVPRVVDLLPLLLRTADNSPQPRMQGVFQTPCQPPRATLFQRTARAVNGALPSGSATSGGSTTFQVVGR